MTSVKRTAGFEIAQPVEDLFPLFSPEGQKLWVPKWDYHNVLGSTDLFEDYVFTTSTHDHAATDAVWVVKRFRPEEYHVEYYKVEPGQKVGVVTVDCTRRDERLTRVNVSYEYIALSNRGDDFINRFGEGQFVEFIGEWEALLLEYFETAP